MPLLLTGLSTWFDWPRLPPATPSKLDPQHSDNEVGALVGKGPQVSLLPIPKAEELVVLGEQAQPAARPEPSHKYDLFTEWAREQLRAEKAANNKPEKRSPAKPA
eukprot:1185753-Prorocentrum_minimum.AAC.1